MTCFECKRWIESIHFEGSDETKSMDEHLKLFPSHHKDLIEMHKKLIRLRIGDYK